MDWKNLVSMVAPWIGAALGGPLGSAAASIVADTLGLNDKTEDAIKQALSGITPDQMLALKKADQDFAIRMQEIGFATLKDMETIAANDRDSARKREMTVQDWTPRILAYIVVGSFIGVVVGVIAGWGEVDTVLAGTLVGYLSAKAEQVISYYFGSTNGSMKKTELLANSTPTKE